MSLTVLRRALAVAALAAAATMMAASEIQAATDSPLLGLRRSIHRLFSPPARTRRAVRRAARIAPMPPHRPQRIDAPHGGAPTVVPMPPRRPVELSKAPPTPPEPQTPPPHHRADAPSPTAPPSSCQSRLTPDIAVAHPLPPITGPGECGAEDVVRLDAVVLRDGQRLTLAPAATLRCTMAEAVAQWVRDELAPAASVLAGKPRNLVVAASYDCRGRNRIVGAKLSEHGRANAIDLRGLTLADGSVVDFTERSVSKEFRERVRQSACARFMTVLGPGSDGYHEQHVHLDLIARKGGYRMCEWDIAPAPDVAVIPMPPQRPRPVANGKH